MYLVTLSWRVIPHAVARFCEIKDGDNADIPSMVYTKFRVNFWVLAILQSKTIVHKGEYIWTTKILAISVKGFNDNVCIFNLDNLALCVNKDRFPYDHVSDEQRYCQAKISFKNLVV